MSPEQIRPYAPTGDKGQQIEAMFDHIAPAYDFMNSAMSLGQHRRWRNRALRLLSQRLGSTRPHSMLDVASGTGDVAFAMAYRFAPVAVTGIDLSNGMLEIGRKRLARTPLPNGSAIQFVHGDCMHLPFDPGVFDAVTAAYGVRNFQDLRKGLGEMYRVLRPGGALCIIELSQPASPLTRIGYKLYTRIIPLIGRAVAGDSDAYAYLPKSIAACPQRDEMTALITDCGFTDADWSSLTLGTVCIYTALKPLQ